MERVQTLLLAIVSMVVFPCFAEESPRVSETLPTGVDLRPEIKNLGLSQRRQGRRGTCSVFATVEAVEFACARQKGAGTALSVEFANWAANEATGRQDDGDFFHNIIKGVEKHGLCPETEMPYHRRFSRETAPSKEAQQQAADFLEQNALDFHRIKDWNRTPGLDDADLQKVKSVLASGYPISAGSYHSVLFVGFEDDASLPGGGRLLISDSNLKETEISYQAAKQRFCDLFWVSVTPKSELPKGTGE